MPEDKFIGTGNESGNLGVQLSIAGRKINVSKDLVEYNNFRKRFSNKAEALKNEHINFYNSRVHTFDGLFEIEIPEVLNKAYSAIKFGNSVLMEYGVDYVSEEELVGMATANGGIKEKLRPIFEQAEEVERYAESLGDYRNVQRAGRSYWQGGGFGLSGAIKGVLTAEALNLGTGVFRSIGDSITNRRDKAEIDKMKNSLATSEMAELYLTNAVYQFCMDVFTCVEKILVSEGKINSVNFNIKRAKSRAKNYISRYQEQKSVSCYNEAVDALCECIQDYPYSSDLYCGLYQILKGDKSEVHSAVKYFGVEYYYKAVIVHKDTELMDRLVEKAGNSTLEGIADIENQIRSIAKNNPYISAYKYLKLLEERKAPFLSNNEKLLAAIKWEEAHEELQKSMEKREPTWDEVVRNWKEDTVDEIKIKEGRLRSIESKYPGSDSSGYLQKLARKKETLQAQVDKELEMAKKREEAQAAFRKSIDEENEADIQEAADDGDLMSMYLENEEEDEVYSSSWASDIKETRAVKENVSVQSGLTKQIAPSIVPRIGTASGEPKPVELKPVESKPIKPKPIEPKRIEPKPVAAPKHVEPKRVEQTTNSTIPKEQAELLKRLEEIKKTGVSPSAQKKVRKSEPQYASSKNPPTNYITKSNSNSAVKRKSKIIAGWLAIFLGAYGIHWFYLDRPLRGVLYFAICMGLFTVSLNQYFFSFCIIEGIYILCMSDKKFESFSQKKGSQERR